MKYSFSNISKYRSILLGIATIWVILYHTNLPFVVKDGPGLIHLFYIACFQLHQLTTAGQVGVDIFLISLKAGGTGLNLTGADTVIHLDPWWNIAAENQASDRTHRIGQTRNVEVIRLIAGDSIEQRVVELQDIKREVIKQVISDSDGSVTSASLEDIAFVLG